jgi:methylmalonyl-CoA/ethylmalonyl-CoA epimerase
VIAGADLDHVAVAAERWSDIQPRYVDELGGAWLGGGPDPGFAWAQILYANGMRLEMLEPHEPERNDFLRRFLDHRGPGPHHLTFKVPDLQSALSQAENAGYRPVNVNMAHPDWKEAFLHPKDAPGVVVQLAQSNEKTPDTLPSPETTASLERVTHAVARLDDGIAIFEGLLGGSPVDGGADDDARWVEFAWPGPGRVRVVAPTTRTGPLVDWLGGAPGRVHHIAFRSPTIAAPVDVEPGDNFGVRLRLTPAR